MFGFRYSLPFEFQTSIQSLKGPATSNCGLNGHAYNVLNNVETNKLHARVCNENQQKQQKNIAVLCSHVHNSHLDFPNHYCAVVEAYTRSSAHAFL